MVLSLSDWFSQLSLCQHNRAAAREKQMRFFRQLESKADASPQNLRRSTQSMQALPQDTEVKFSKFRFFTQTSEENFGDLFLKFHSVSK